MDAEGLLAKARMGLSRAGTPGFLRNSLARGNELSLEFNDILTDVQFQWLISAIFLSGCQRTAIGHPRPAFPQPARGSACEGIQPLDLVIGLQIQALSDHDTD